jgi:hypothetical protein
MVEVVTGIISSLCAIGLDRDSALAAEDHLIKKYSLSSRFPDGLNMTSGTHVSSR